jgi:hypothetical protein
MHRIRRPHPQCHYDAGRTATHDDDPLGPAPHCTRAVGAIADMGQGLDFTLVVRCFRYSFLIRDCPLPGSEFCTCLFKVEKLFCLHSLCLGTYRHVVLPACLSRDCCCRLDRCLNVSAAKHYILAIKKSIAGRQHAREQTS